MTAAFEGKTVVLGVSGGIAAYKAVELLRRLSDAGARVTPILTEAATRFVGAATFSALAAEPAHVSMFEDADPIPHTRIAKRADIVIVAPATARLIGSYAAGISSDLLVATLLATRAPVLLCPAMHDEMWEHPAVRDNLALLARRGVAVLEPDAGRLAGGDAGTGRLPETSRILAVAEELLSRGAGDLRGVEVLVTAGGTREPIDPVRYVGNRSSGKQGYALAQAAARRGARVCLVTTSLAEPVGVAEVVAVETAAEMAEEVFARAERSDVIVMAAAVADFRPKAAAPAKWKKSDGLPDIVLEPTLDILAELGRRRSPHQVLVGFAAETGAVAAEAARKLSEKKVDVIVGNDVTAAGAGFAGNTNAVTIVTATGATEVPLASKLEVADAVLDAAVRELLARRAPDEPGATTKEQRDR